MLTYLGDLVDTTYISLVSVCIGWSLSQLTELIKNKLKKSKIKNAVKCEIKDIGSIISGARNSALKAAKSYGKNGNFGFSLAGHIELPITEKYYTEIFALFNESQRKNYRMLLKHLDLYNQTVDSFNKERDGKFTQDLIIHKLFNAYKNLAFACVFINSLTNDEIIDEHHPKLVMLRKRFKKQVSTLALSFIQG
jgi:hypothetical protein